MGSVKAVELWWSRELLRISTICQTTMHLLDDTALADMWHAAQDISDIVEREWENRERA